MVFDIWFIWQRFVYARTINALFAGRFCSLVKREESKKRESCLKMSISRVDSVESAIIERISLNAYLTMVCDTYLISVSEAMDWEFAGSTVYLK